MARKFVTLRVWHPDCWMLELSERHRDVCVESRGVCTHGDHVHADAMIHAASSEALDSALGSAMPSDVHTEVLYRGHDHAEVYTSYPGYRSMYAQTMKSGFLLVSPVVHANGSERWEVVADASELSAGLATLREVADIRVERISEQRAPPHNARESLMARVAEDLSERQYAVLSRAVAHGYYDWPRGKNVKTLAKELGISGPTCLEHIRRAESRIVPEVVRELERLRGRKSA